MSETLHTIREMLLERNLRPSYHRMKVLEYLISNRVHPTVDQIFRTLYKEIPTLSKATVYNALNTFAAARLIRIINIENNEIRYDIVIEPHGHFKCEVCGEIYNFQVDFEGLVVSGLKGFKVNDKNVYFKGVCPGCLSNKN